MKKVLLLALLVFNISVMNSFGIEVPKDVKDIVLKNKGNNPINPLMASADNLLTVNSIAATIDGSLVQIYSEITIENLTVIITNNLGQVVYSNSSYIDGITALPISLAGNNSGEYTIEILYSDVDLVGEFYLE